jgi:hypothetical protein
MLDKPGSSDSKKTFNSRKIKKDIVEIKKTVLPRNTCKKNTTKASSQHKTSVPPKPNSAKRKPLSKVNDGSLHHENLPPVTHFHNALNVNLPSNPSPPYKSHTVGTFNIRPFTPPVSQFYNAPAVNLPSNTSPPIPKFDHAPIVNFPSNPIPPYKSPIQGSSNVTPHFRPSVGSNNPPFPLSSPNVQSQPVSCHTNPTTSQQQFNKGKQPMNVHSLGVNLLHKFTETFVQNNITSPSVATTSKRKKQTHPLEPPRFNLPKFDATDSATFSESDEGSSDDSTDNDADNDDEDDDLDTHQSGYPDSDLNSFSGKCYNI